MIPFVYRFNVMHVGKHGVYKLPLERVTYLTKEKTCFLPINLRLRDRNPLYYVAFICMSANFYHR